LSELQLILSSFLTYLSMTMLRVHEFVEKAIVPVEANRIYAIAPRRFSPPANEIRNLDIGRAPKNFFYSPSKYPFFSPPDSVFFYTPPRLLITFGRLSVTPSSLSTSRGPRIGRGACRARAKNLFKTLRSPRALSHNAVYW